MKRILEEVRRRTLPEQNKILLLGFGKEGRSTYKVLRTIYPDRTLYIMDSGLIAPNDLCEKDIIVPYVLEAIDDFDVIFKSPGISLNWTDNKINSEKITSQTDIMLSACSDKMIGVTGTKGKSTTTSIIFEIIHSFNLNSVLAGNIGIPFFDTLQHINEDTLIVSELSCHQLEFTTKSPAISVITNFFQEHLDHYPSYLDYLKAKMNIAVNQTYENFLIYCIDEAELLDRLSREKIFAQKVNYSVEKEASCYINNQRIYWANNGEFEYIMDINEDNVQIRGKHNMKNVLASICVAKILNIPNEIISFSVSGFKGLPHRTQNVGIYNGVSFYDDSISTTPETTINAIETLKFVNTVIIGGKNRNIDYTSLIKYLSDETKVNTIILLGEVGEILFEKISNKKNVFIETTMENVVKRVFDITPVGGVCLLSPAASSYDMFDNFESRGQQFLSEIKKYTGN